MQVAVVGAGASGLSFALFWGRGVHIFESDESVGGHARSISKSGFLWDRGPHMMFSKDKPVLQFMTTSLGDNIHTCRRNNVVKVAGRTLRYPLENDLGELPGDVALACLSDYIEAQISLQGAPPPSDLESWFRGHFGDSLTDLYFRPYNEKVWNLPLSKLSMLWADRIPNPPVRDVIAGALGQVRAGYTHQLFYQYPRKGGFGALMRSWADALPDKAISLNHRLQHILPTSRGVRITFANGRVEDVESVVTTAPLLETCLAVEGCPPEVIEQARSLVVNPMVIANFGFPVEDENQFTAVYIPDSDFMVNRVSYPAVYSPMNAPPGHHVVQAEITASPESTVMSLPDESVIRHTLTGLRARGLAPTCDPCLISLERYEKAYIVYDTGYENRLAPILTWLESRNIFAHGRFGSHNYLNVDGCVRQSIELVKKLGRDCADASVAAFFGATDAS